MRGSWGTPNCSALGIPGWFLRMAGSGGGCSIQPWGAASPGSAGADVPLLWSQGAVSSILHAAACTMAVVPHSCLSFPNSCCGFGKPQGNPASLTAQGKFCSLGFAPSGLGAAWCGVAGTVLRVHACYAGIVMFAVGVGKAVEEELRAIASEPVEQHFSYSADFTTMTHLVENFKLNICPGGCPQP